ncbi:hypothetical protein EC973_003086, partial [Apophysomyces ossiformis]
DAHTRQDLFELDPVHGGERLQPDRVARIPYTTRSSRSYKQKEDLDLHTVMCQLGEPQMCFYDQLRGF